MAIRLYLVAENGRHTHPYATSPKTESISDLSMDAYRMGDVHLPANVGEDGTAKLARSHVLTFPELDGQQKTVASLHRQLSKWPGLA